MLDILVSQAGGRGEAPTKICQWTHLPPTWVVRRIQALVVLSTGTCAGANPTHSGIRHRGPGPRLGSAGELRRKCESHSCCWLGLAKIDSHACARHLRLPLSSFLSALMLCREVEVAACAHRLWHAVHNLLLTSYAGLHKMSPHTSTRCPVKREKKGGEADLHITADNWALQGT